jgi:hypothetical protein
VPKSLVGNSPWDSRSAIEPDVVDPSPRLGNCGEQSITALGFIAGFDDGE